MPRRWSLCLEGLNRKRRGFALLCFPRFPRWYTRLLCVAAALGFVPHGQWALLDADMLALIDRSACPVEPFFFHPPRGPVTTSNRFPSRVIPHGPVHDVPS